jgi:hypothetical protein
MIRIVVCSGLLVAFSLQTGTPTHAAQSKQNTAACEMVVETGAALAGYGLAAANRLKELARLVATEIGDKIGGKFIARWICGTDDVKTTITPTAPTLPRVTLPDYEASNTHSFGLKPNSALGSSCLSLGLSAANCFGSSDLQGMRDGIRNDVFKYLSVQQDRAAEQVTPNLNTDWLELYIRELESPCTLDRLLDPPASSAPNKTQSHLC